MSRLFPPPLPPAGLAVLHVVGGAVAAAGWVAAGGHAAAAVAWAALPLGACAQTGYTAGELLARRWEELEATGDGREASEGPAGRIRAGRAGQDAQAVWIIGLTADAAEAERERGARDGCNDCLVKAVRLADLESALKKTRGRRAAFKY